MNQTFGRLQKIGKALMLPVAVLPIAGLLLRFGVLLDIKVMTAAGSAIFDNLPLLFAIGVAVGLAKGNQGAAGLAGTVSYFTITTIAKVYNDKINMGVLAGIIAGVLAGNLYNKYHDIKLPDWLGFFGGKRFVPIVTSLASILVGIASGYIWPTIQFGIDGVGNWLIGAGSLGVFVFGVLNRLLLPLGLHHILNSIVWFVFGTFNGKTGDLNRFFAGDPTAGSFMTGFFPIMMFGLPAAALAMYFAAKKENRHMVGGALFSVAFTAFLTGITEPIEYLFMFLAPPLYLIHALLTGTALAVCHMLGIHDGFSFSAGAVDYIVNFSAAQKPLLLIPIGLVYGAIYFFLFYFAIKKFDLQTPGRTDEDAEGVNIAIKDRGVGSVSKEYFEALGGKANLVEVDSCITRLRLTVNDATKIDEARIKSLGASGIVKPNNKNIQVIVGTSAELIAEEMKHFLQ